MALPRYKLLKDSFFAPDLLKAGSIITYDGPPGDHLLPLNAEGEARMEAWYTEVHGFSRDHKGNITDTPYRPHEAFRIRQTERGQVYEVTLESPPPVDQAGTLDLAQTLYASKKSTDQRPGPAPHSGPQPEVPSGASVLAVEEAAAPVTTITKKV